MDVKTEEMSYFLTKIAESCIEMRILVLLKKFVEPNLSKPKQT